MQGPLNVIFSATLLNLKNAVTRKMQEKIYEITPFSLTYGTLMQELHYNHGLLQ